MLSNPLLIPLLLLFVISMLLCLSMWYQSQKNQTLTSTLLSMMESQRQNHQEELKRLTNLLSSKDVITFNSLQALSTPGAAGVPMLTEEELERRAAELNNERTDELTDEDGEFLAEYGIPGFGQ